MLAGKNDLARGDIISATEKDSTERLHELLEYMEPTSGMRLRLTSAWQRIRSGVFEFATHADACYKHLGVAGCYCYIYHIII